MTALTTEQRKVRLARWVKWGAGLAGAAIIAPIVFLAIQGLIGLIVAGVLGLVIVHGAPVLATMFANWKIKAIKAEAARNPVETMQAVLQEKDQAVKAFAQRVEDFATEVRNFGDKLDGFRTQFPVEAPKFEDNLRSMKKLLDLRRQRLREARDELGRFESEIRKVDAIWKMSLAASSMHRAAGMTEDSIMQRIKTETAIDSVQSSLNRALSQLETSLSEESAAIEHDPSPTIDVTAVEVRERVRL
jgi:flagellar biosynthesis chaperone FliJ